MAKKRRKRLSKDQVKKLTKNVPVTRYPRKIENNYATIINRYVYSWERKAKEFVNTHLRPYVIGGVSTLNDDDKHEDKGKKHYGKAWNDLIAAYLSQLNIDIQKQFNPELTYSNVYRFVAAVNQFELANVKVQVGAIGVNPIANNADIQSMLNFKIKQNVALIKSLNGKYASDLEKDIYRILEEGGGVSALTEAIVKRTGMTIKHAKLIATDQTGKILGQLNAYRSTKAGAKYYIWQSMEDNRVRPAHQELDQTMQKYNDAGSGDGGLMPGEPINCRCVAIPVFDSNVTDDDLG